MMYKKAIVLALTLGIVVVSGTAASAHVGVYRWTTANYTQASPTFGGVKAEGNSSSSADSAKTWVVQTGDSNHYDGKVGVNGFVEAGSQSGYMGWKRDWDAVAQYSGGMVAARHEMIYGHYE